MVSLLLSEIQDIIVYSILKKKHDKIVLLLEII